MTSPISDSSGSAQSTGNESHQEQDLQSVLNDISKSLEGISSAFVEYDACTERFMELPSQCPTFQDDVIAFGKDIDAQESRQMSILEEMRHNLSDYISQEVESVLKNELPDIFWEEAVDMIEDEVDEQIIDYLPISLQDQADESRKQLQDIKISLENSKARILNSFVEFTDLYDPLEPILTPNGETSPHYPPTVNSLFRYNLDKTKALNKDYGLSDVGDLGTHFKQFLRHIGTNVDVANVDVVIPDDPGPPTINIEEADG